MRTLAIFVCCTTLFGTVAAAQDFQSVAADVDPYSLEAATQGPALPDIGDFRVDYERRAGFETGTPQLPPDAWKPPEPNWIDPSLQVAGAKVKPDIKHKGVKVAFQIWNADEPNRDDEAN